MISKAIKYVVYLPLFENMNSNSAFKLIGSCKDIYMHNFEKLVYIGSGTGCISGGLYRIYRAGQNNYDILETTILVLTGSVIGTLVGIRAAQE